MKKVIFLAQYGQSSASFMAYLLKGCGYETAVTIGEGKGELAGADLIVIDICGTKAGKKLRDFLKENPLFPYILCGCKGCKDKEFVWGDDDYELLKKIIRFFEGKLPHETS